MNFRGPPRPHVVSNLPNMLFGRGRRPKFPIRNLAKSAVLRAAYPNFSFRHLPRTSADCRFHMYGVIWTSGWSPNPAGQYWGKIVLFGCAYPCIELAAWYSAMAAVRSCETEPRNALTSPPPHARNYKNTLSQFPGLGGKERTPVYLIYDAITKSENAKNLTHIPIIIYAQ